MSLDPYLKDSVKFVVVEIQLLLDDLHGGPDMHTNYVKMRDLEAL